MTDENVKYYGDGDMSVGYEAKKAFALLDRFSEDADLRNINEVLSLYNCTKFIEKKIWLREFTDDDIKKYTKLRGPVERSLAKYFNSVSEANISERFSGADFELMDDLVALVMRYELPSRISGPILLKALGLNGTGIHAMLQNKDFVKQYTAELKHELLNDSNPEHLEYIVRSAVRDLDPKKFYLPELSSEEREDAINAYLDSEHPLPNYVERIAINVHAASDKTRLKAKKLHEKMINELLAGSGSKVEHGILVKIKDGQEEPVLTKCDNLEMEVSFSQKYLDSLTTGEALFGFAAGAFGITDDDSILTLPSYKSETSTLEKAFSNLSEDDYLNASAFQLKQQVTLMPFAACAFYLDEHGRSFESMLSWFYGTYLKDRFGASGFRYTASTSKTYAEKIKHIFSEMDSIMRQFKLYVENRKIDPELLELSSNVPTFQELPSLVGDKYLCPNPKSPEIQQILFLTCSDQSGLTSTKGGLCESSLLELVAKNEVNYGDFHGYQRKGIDWLMGEGVLTRKGDTISCEKLVAAILWQLNRREAIIPMCYREPVQEILRRWQEKGLLVVRNTLLTEAESNYYNFCMNNKSFPNSLAIRNKYAHGAKAFSPEDEQRMDYALALILAVGLMIKIHFDFVLDSLTRK